MSFSAFISHSVSPAELGIVSAIAEEAARRGTQPYIPDRTWDAHLHALIRRRAAC